MESEFSGSVALLITYASLALVVSFLCSIAEAVLLTVSPSYVEALKEPRPKSAAILNELKSNIDRPLAAILTLNTIAHTVGAVGVGAEAGALWGSQGIGVASALMTLLVLVASEIIPKTIGAVYWRALAVPTARAVRVLIRLVAPVVWFSEAITRAFSNGEREVVTRGEVAAMAELSAESGDLKMVENRILHNLLRLESLKVEDIMTPRTVVIALPEDKTVGEVVEEASQAPVSRIPIYQDTIDDVTGFVLKHDILLAQAQDHPEKQLKTLCRSLNTVPATASLHTMFEMFIARRDHIARVIDEYGGTDGIVSMEDLVETLLGVEIVDEADQEEDMQRLARRQWQQRATALGLPLTAAKGDSSVSR